MDWSQVAQVGGTAFMGFLIWKIANNDLRHIGTGIDQLTHGQNELLSELRKIVYIFKKRK